MWHICFMEHTRLYRRQLASCNFLCGYESRSCSAYIVHIMKGLCTVQQQEEAGNYIQKQMTFLLIVFSPPPPHPFFWLQEGQFHYTQTHRHTLAAFQKDQAWFQCAGRLKHDSFTNDRHLCATQLVNKKYFFNIFFLAAAATSGKLS